MVVSAPPNLPAGECDAADALAASISPVVRNSPDSTVGCRWNV